MTLSDDPRLMHLSGMTGLNLTNFLSFTLQESPGTLTVGKAQGPSEAWYSAPPAVIEPPKSCKTIISRSPSDRDSGSRNDTRRSSYYRDPAVNPEGQIGNRPNDVGKLGGANASSSAPLTNVSRARSRLGKSTDELSKDNLEHIGEKKDMFDWINSIKDALSPSLPTYISPSLPTYSPGSSSCSLETMPQHFAPGESLKKSRALVMELFRTLSHQDCEFSSDEPWSADGSPIQSIYSSAPLTDESGVDTSPKSGTTTSTSGFERPSKRSHPTRAGSSQGGDGDETSRKESRREKDSSNPEARFRWGVIHQLQLH
ncbi:hypothetical protein FGADI_677 [Fusarium gaditjirri]|uniref:Uncharacterized protein n=1 Tax=Fusarium gaditjirri TaxID=282569 RepID=A0A8H4X4N0_9HYPO|nr:hypothetical protein FGADI_677 [Fusarium gaditjirri]